MRAMLDRALEEELDGTDLDISSGSFDTFPASPPPRAPPSGSSFFLANLFGLDDWTLRHTLVASGSALGLVFLLCAFGVLFRGCKRPRPATAAGWSRWGAGNGANHSAAVNTGDDASRAQPSSPPPGSTQFFGMPLHDAALSTAPGGWAVPETLLQLWVALLAKRDDGIEMKGIFRIAPDYEELSEVKAALQVPSPWS